MKSHHIGPSAGLRWTTLHSNARGVVLALSENQTALVVKTEGLHLKMAVELVACLFIPKLYTI